MARGARPVVSAPSKVIRPDAIGSIPKQARATSDLPEPTRPARPTTSPARTSMVTFETVPVASVKSSTSSKVLPGSKRISGKICSITRPVMSSSNSVSVTFLASTVSTWRPSRSTVMRSPMRRISLMRWVM